MEWLHWNIFRIVARILAWHGYVWHNPVPTGLRKVNQKQTRFLDFKRLGSRKLTLQETETYLGGLSSPLLGRGRRWGYGLAITNLRVIGFKSTWSRVTLLAGPAIAAAGGISYLAQSLVLSNSISPGYQVIVLGTLGTLGTAFFLAVYFVGPSRPRSAGVVNMSKDFEVRKELVSGIGMKQPQGFAIGHVTIGLQSGHTIKIVIGNKRVFGKTEELVRAFYPEVRESP